MTLIDKETIRAEIERLIKAQLDKNGKAKNSFCAVRMWAYADLLYFLDTLPEQPKLKPMNIPSAGSGAMGTTPPKFKLVVEPEQPVEWKDEYREEDLRTRFAFYTYKNEEDDGVLYLSNVFVEEASRNAGFGTKILEAAEKVAETIGAITIRLKVKQDSPANAWYRKHGYGYIAFEGDYDWLEKNLEYLKPKRKEQPVEKKSNALFDKCVENCDPAVMKEVSDNVDKMLGRQPVEGLEEEIKRYFQGLWPGMETAEQCNTDMRFTPPAIMRLARHFAEWGVKHLKR